MIKLVYCVRKRADVSDEDFHSYWLNNHGPLVRSVAEAIQARRYVQSHTLRTELNEAIRKSRGLEAAYDGITEVWWDSLDAYRAGLNTLEGVEARNRLLQDEATFIDFSQSRVFLTEEHVIFDR